MKKNRWPFDCRLSCCYQSMNINSKVRARDQLGYTTDTTIINDIEDAYIRLHLKTITNHHKWCGLL